MKGNDPRTRRCVFCGDVGPRQKVDGGYSHKRCLPGNEPPPPREVLPIPPSLFRTILAPGAPWPFA